MKLLKNIILALSICICGLIVQGCDDEFGFGEQNSTRPIGGAYREISTETRRALIVFSDGYNSLSSYLEDDIDDLQEGYFPPVGRDNNLLFLISSLPAKSGDYTTKTSPVIIRMYKDFAGENIMDTLKTYPAGTMLVDKDVMTDALTFIKDNYPAKSYGMVYSSHATGYLPEHYYNNSKASSSSISLTGLETIDNVYRPIIQDPNLPAVKSIGQESHKESGVTMSYEMSIADFCDAIPMHLEYLLFDACLMGGIEVAYEFKDKADVIGFSPTEVLADGFDYTSLASLLIENNEPDPVGICSEYFERYNAKSGVSRSATITLVDCQYLDKVADACAFLFDKYASEIASVNPKKVQGFFRMDKHWYYDMQDILKKSGVSDEDMVLLTSALEPCIIYKNATPKFMNEFTINAYCGLTMFLPCDGSNYIKNYYKTLKWNQATSLVK